MLSLLQNYPALHVTFHRRLLSKTTRIVTKENLPSIAYKPEIVENNKYEDWEEKGLFKAKNGSKTPTFSMVLPPPNVTGKLHLGHALACSLQDVIVRRKRSLGHHVLWLPGTDHAGIATQGVVEKYIKSKENLSRHNIGRERFIQEVWKWKEQHGDTICHQLRTLGCSLDWSRQVFTMDAKHTHAVNTAFIKLFQKGLIYRKKALVNWCNALKSTVSDIEVDSLAINGLTDVFLPSYGKIVKFGRLYEFAYKVVNSDEEIIVATTMPETMLGDTAIAVHPDDERYKHLTGKFVDHPFRNQSIPIIFDKFVDMKFGTGAVKITPAHSKIDYQIGKKYNLPLIQVIGEDGCIKNGFPFETMRTYDCRDAIVHSLEDMGLMKKISPHQMTLPVCSRTGDVIEYLPKEQWFLSCSKLNEKAAEVVKSNKLKIEPEKFVKNWLNWTEDDRDWCISRQLWWGHQIPAYKCTVERDVVWIAAADEIAAKSEAAKYLRAPPDSIHVEKDTDVLDTWFSSGIYPFAALGWPDKTTDLNEFYPLNLMATGHDILGFWVHRMVILGLELTGKLPFENVLLHGIICDNKGAKMSKSKGNVIDPIDVINGISMDDLADKTKEMHKSGVLNNDELKKAMAYHKTNYSNTGGIPQCGVDALRFTLLSQDVKSHFVSFDLAYCHSNKLFCNKIWQSVKYLQLSFEKLKTTQTEITRNDLQFIDKWILSRLADMVEKTNGAMDNNDFHLATKALRTLIYNEFCDVYLEATKPGFDGNYITGYAHAHTLSAVLNVSLRSLNPFMVYLTDEIIPKIPGFDRNIIHNFNDLDKDGFDCPKTVDFKIWKDEHIEAKMDKVLNSINLIRGLKGLYNIPNKPQSSIKVNTTDNSLKSDLQINKDIVLHLTRCSEIIFDESDKKYVGGSLDKNTEISVEIIGDNDENSILAARQKIQKKIKKLEEHLSKMENKISSAPEWIQTSDREKMETKRTELENLQRLI